MAISANRTSRIVATLILALILLSACVSIDSHVIKPSYKIALISIYQEHDLQTQAYLANTPTNKLIPEKTIELLANSGQFTLVSGDSVTSNPHYKELIAMTATDINGMKYWPYADYKILSLN